MYPKIFKIKVLVAKIIYKVIHIFIKDEIVHLKRKGMNWVVRINDIVGLSIFLTGGFQTRKLKQFSSFITSPSLLLDIGGNLGSFSIVISRFNQNISKILIIEPDSNNLTLLQQNITNNGLSTKTTILQKYVGSIDSSSSSSYPLDAPELDLNMYNGFPGDFIDVGQFDTKIIHEQVGELNLAIKIDVDGNEAAVIRSLEKIIEKYHPVILLELNKILLEENDIEYIESVLSMNNYKIILGKKTFEADQLGNFKKAFGLDLILK